MEMRSPEYLEKLATPLRIFTTGGIVEGNFHHAEGTRLSDSIRNMKRDEPYIRLTDVAFRPNGGGEPVEGIPFALVNTAHAILFVPLD